MTPDEILTGLSRQQAEAATTVAGPLLVSAGPGSGKTRTITHRIAYAVAAGAHDPARSLAVTFTTRAAGELRRRLVPLGAGTVTVRTFHSAALRQLRYFWPDAIGGTPPRIETNRGPLLQAAAQRCGVEDTANVIADLQTELDWLKAHGLTAGSYAAASAGRTLPLGAAAVASVLEAYEAVKTERTVMDFDDVLLITVGLLDSRTDLRESVRRAFRWITVDEYQDVSPLQQRLLDLWLGDSPQLCAVGDPAQAIYQFAGADPSLIRSFPQRYRDATVVELADTYRCRPAIVAAANRLGEGIAGSVSLRSAGHQVEPGNIQVLQFPNDASEAAGIADEIAGLLAAGHRADQIACLFRANHQGRLLQDAFRRRQLPFSTRGMDRFYDRPEVQEAVTRLRGEVRLDPARSAADAITAVLDAMGHDNEPPDTPGARNRWESLAALSALVAGTGPAGDALESLQVRIEEGEPPTAPGVQLLTMHSAKGLEWATVFLVGASDGLLPYGRATTVENQDEERRLAYVAVTRAERRLVVSWASVGPRGERRRPSPYLAAISSDAAASIRRAAPQPATGQGESPASVDHAGEGLPPARCRVCGAALVTGVERVLGRCEGCPSSVDADVLAALTLWRDTVAFAAGIPSHAVLTDVTLLAIAEQRPDSLERVAGIPGMRADKVARFGTEILTVIHSAPVRPAAPMTPG